MRKKTIDTIPILSEKMKEILQTFSRSRTLPASLVKRSQIILMSSQGKTNLEISAEVGLYNDHVATWRNRFLENLQNLTEIEILDSEKLSEEIVRVLSDKPRSGCPPTYTPEQVIQIINLACKNPQDYGYEVSHWNLPLLTSEIIKSGIADQMSAKTVSRFLKSGRFKTT
jgi:hypothetical protein